MHILFTLTLSQGPQKHIGVCSRLHGPFVVHTRGPGERLPASHHQGFHKGKKKQFKCCLVQIMTSQLLKFPGLPAFQQLEDDSEGKSVYENMAVVLKLVLMDMRLKATEEDGAANVFLPIK